MVSGNEIGFQGPRIAKFPVKFPDSREIGWRRARSALQRQPGRRRPGADHHCAIPERALDAGTIADRDSEMTVDTMLFRTSCRIRDDLKLHKLVPDTGQRSEVHEQANKNDIAA